MLNYLAFRLNTAERQMIRSHCLMGPAQVCRILRWQPLLSVWPSKRELRLRSMSDGGRSCYPHFECPHAEQVMHPSAICIENDPQDGQAGPRGRSPTAMTCALGSDFRPRPSPSIKPISIIWRSITPPMGREDRWHIAPLHPRAAARVENGFQFFDHKTHIAAAPEHG